MKSLKEFGPVVKALEKVATEALVSHNNGTLGGEYLCHLWEWESVYQKERAVLEKERLKALLAGDVAQVNKLNADLLALPDAKKTLIFKLIDPIKHLVGTKTVLNELDKPMSPVMTNVDLIHVSEDYLQINDAIEFEELPETALDKQGKETPIIKIHLKTTIIDVAEAKSWDGKKKYKDAKAWVTIISYRSMQVAGILLSEEKNKKAKRFGFSDL